MCVSKVSSKAKSTSFRVPVKELSRTTRVFPLALLVACFHVSPIFRVNEAIENRLCMHMQHTHLDIHAHKHTYACTETAAVLFKGRLKDAEALMSRLRCELPLSFIPSLSSMGIVQESDGTEGDVKRTGAMKHGSERCTEKKLLVAKGFLFSFFFPVAYSLTPHGAFSCSDRARELRKGTLSKRPCCCLSQRWAGPCDREIR